MNLKTTALLLLVCSMGLLGSCRPQPLTDMQVQTIVDRCKELGMAARIFSGITIFVECIPITRTGT